MTILQLKYFLSICNLGGIRATAEREHVSEPAISVALKRLEEELGFPLFFRHKKQLILTEDGEYLRELAMEAVEKFDRIQDDIEQRKNEQLGVLRVGIPTSLSGYLFASLFTTYMENRPGALFEFIPGASGEQIRRVEEGYLELAICDSSEVENKNLDFVPLIRTDLVGVVSCDHPLAKLEYASPKELKDEGLLFVSEAASITKWIRKWFYAQNIEPKVRAYSNQANITVSLLKSSKAVTFCLREVFSSNPVFQQEDLRSFSLLPSIRLIYGILCKENVKLSKKAQFFYGYCRNHVLRKEE